MDVQNQEKKVLLWGVEAPYVAYTVSCTSGVSIEHRSREEFTGRASDLISILQQYDFVFLPLTLNAFLSLRIVYTIHQANLATRSVLVTKGRTEYAEDLFDFVTYGTKGPFTSGAWLDSRVPRIEDERVLLERIKALFFDNYCFKKYSALRESS